MESRVMQIEGRRDALPTALVVSEGFFESTNLLFRDE